MNKINQYLAGILLTALSIMPSIPFKIAPPHDWWPWFVVLSGFSGFYLCWLTDNFFIKCFAVGGFAHCFFSNAPYISFTAYISFVACLYLFVFFKSLKDYEIPFQFLQTVLIFNVAMFFFQYSGIDRLLNFGRGLSMINDFCFGVVGQRMQSASFSVILAAALIPYRSYNLLFSFGASALCNSAGAFLCASIGATCLITKSWFKKHIIQLFVILISVFVTWMILSGKFTTNLDHHVGRVAVWKRAIELSFYHPFSGWGMATFKAIYPGLANINYSGNAARPWLMAHNCWIQMIFELGYPAIIFVIAFALNLFIKMCRLTRREAFRNQAFACMAGMSMISVNMMFHFPTRMIQSVPIIIFFLAYCQEVIDRGRRQC